MSDRTRLTGCTRTDDRPLAVTLPQEAGYHSGHDQTAKRHHMCDHGPLPDRRPTIVDSSPSHNTFLSSCSYRYVAYYIQSALPICAWPLQVPSHAEYENRR